MIFFSSKCFEFYSICIQRLKDGSTALACMVATATSQGNLLIFHQRKLLKCCQLPFRDCSEILLYHSFQSGVTKEFLVAVSFTKGGVVIDLQQSSVSYTTIVLSIPDNLITFCIFISRLLSHGLLLKKQEIQKNYT